MNRPLKTIIVGGGHRSLTYAELANIEKDKMEIVGVADPDQNRRETIAKKFFVVIESKYGLRLTGTAMRTGTSDGIPLRHSL